MRLTAMYVITIIVCVLVGFGLTVAYRAMVVRRALSVPFSSTPSDFHFDPPSDALQGLVTKLSGEVSKVPRDSTASASLRPGDALIVGETVTTEARSDATISIGENISFTLGSGSSVAYSNGLPSSLLLVQQAGSVTYTSRTTPLSIRAWHALISLNDGSVSLIFDPLRHQATLHLLSGTASVAMIDTNNQTHYLELSTTPVLINDNTRTLSLIVKKIPVKQRR